MPRKATPDMDRAKVNRGLALSFEPEYEHKPEITSELFLKTPRCWHSLLQFTRVDELDVNSSGWQPRDFFTSPDLVLMCLEWLRSLGTHVVFSDDAGEPTVDVHLRYQDCHSSATRATGVERTHAATLSEAIIIATAKAKGIER